VALRLEEGQKLQTFERTTSDKQYRLASRRSSIGLGLEGDCLKLAVLLQ
jgi:hypothetical protein